MNIRVNDFFIIHTRNRINRVSWVKSSTVLVLSVYKNDPSKYRVLNFVKGKRYITYLKSDI